MSFVGDILGGGSDTTTTTVNYPPWMEELMQDRARLARTVGSIGPMMYTGPSVAAPSPQTLAAMGNTNALAQAFGMSTAAPMAGLPQPQSFGGVSGYSAFPMIRSAYQQLPEVQRGLYESLYGPGGLFDPTREPEEDDLLGAIFEGARVPYGGSNSDGYNDWGDTHGIYQGGYNEADPGEMADDW